MGAAARTPKPSTGSAVPAAATAASARGSAVLTARNAAAGRLGVEELHRERQRLGHCGTEKVHAVHLVGPLLERNAE